MNRSTCGASSRLPFGGIKKSGNHRPSALLAGRYCTYPQAQLRQEPGWDPKTLESGPLSYLE
jgi:succinylglutamic semialdehyde dehydrogenase